MPRYFFDTSALVKRYHAETGTPEVQRLLAVPRAECIISRLATVEMVSGFAGKVRTGVFSSAAFPRLRSQFLADVKKRVVRPVRVINAHYLLAGELIGKHGMSRQLRTLDAVHLAVVLRLHQALPIDHFVCADQRLCDVALLEGLSVINPEMTP
jgi:predicted nucleic acid-binding protein